MRRFTKLCAVVAVAASASVAAAATNPLVTNVRTADPSPLVVGNTFYIVVGEDQPNATGFDMYGWHILSSTDMNTWRDSGVILRPSSVSWLPDNAAWASDIVHRNGTFYFFASGSNQIGVLTSNSIFGPYADVNGRPLLDAGTPGAARRTIDPHVFTDDDGTSYLFYGGDNTCRYVQLSSSLTALAGAVRDVPGLQGYLEAPYVFKANGVYFLIYAADGWPGNIRYATSASIHGPWTHRGIVGPRTGTGTNHAGVEFFDGWWRYVYHTEVLSNGNPYSRSVSADRLIVNGDQLIPVVYNGRYAGNGDLESYNFPGHFLGHNNYRGTLQYAFANADDDEWVARPGLANASGVSFESVNFPGYFLRHYNYELSLVRNDGSAQFAADATFYRRPGLADAAWASYEAYNLAGYYIAHQNFYANLIRPTSAQNGDATFRPIGTSGGGTGTTSRLQFRHSGKCADVSGVSTADGARVLQWSCHTNANQRWQQRVSGGTITLVAQHSGKCLDVANASTANGAAIQQYTCNGSAGQQWTREDMGGGYFRLRSRLSNRCVDVSGASTADGGTLVQWDCHTGSNQQVREY